jgi:prolyl oligopeptidase
MRRSAALVLILIGAACGGGSKTGTGTGTGTDTGTGTGAGTTTGSGTGTGTGTTTTPTPGAYAYPAARRDASVVDDYHGTKVADPYRWLENTDAPETRTWIEAENKLTFSFLDQIPERPEIAKRMTELWNFEKYTPPFARGKRWFFTKNDGLQNQSVLYWAAKLDGAPKVLLDPNTLAADGTIALGGASVSDNGAYLAYALESAGSDWMTWKVRDVATGKDFDDEIKWSKFSDAQWTKDGKGFFYARYPEPKGGGELTGENLNHTLWYHRVGTAQTADQLVFERPDQPTWFSNAVVTEDGKYLFVIEQKGTGPQSLVSWSPLKDTKPDQRKVALVPLIKDWEAEYTLLGNDGSIAYFKTDLDAPRGRIIAIDLARPDKAAWKELVPQAKEAIASASIVGNRILLHYLVDAQSAVKVFDLAGKLVREVKLPGIGSADGFGGRRTDKQTFYSFTGFTTPGAVYRYDLKSGKSTLWKQPKLDFDGAAYATEQVFYPSKDGTKIPMFIVHKKDIALDGNNPTLLYGYGGFSNSETPYFSPVVATWLERGGIYAVANLRGGGEYGEEWHLAGTKLHKQNVFDDFIAAAEYLIAQKYTRPQRLAIKGASNGGLLIGAMITQRPELFGAALPQVGVMDMLRFHKFTIGYAWVDDYGSSDNADEFKALYAYSPLHNIKPGVKYPPTLATSGDHDDRVVPGHSFKFMATLQHAQAGDAPVMIRIETKGGHGGGKPTAMKIAENADLLAFVTAVFKTN